MWARSIGWKSCASFTCSALVGVWALLLPSQTKAAGASDALVLAAQIDEQVALGWKKAGAQAAPLADDAEFLRRVSLHLSGCIPDVATARRFLADSSPDKRQLYVEELLDGPGYVTNFTRFWRSAMLPEADSDPMLGGQASSFEAWLRQQLADDAPYDKIVRQVIHIEAPPGNPRLDPRIQDQSPSPRAFYFARQSAPPEMTAAATRAFLGVRIECAQCHDHPFDEWKRDHFWSFAAFFGSSVPGRSRENSAAVSDEPAPPTIAIPDTNRVVQATFLGGATPEWHLKATAREVLAEWVTSRDNPYFARAAANRIWGYLFGVGLVNPIDDFSRHNPASHPELLDLLAREFVLHDFDLKFLLRAITASKTYQLTSRRTDQSQDNRRLFARMAVQALTPVQIYDSLLQATGQRQPFQPFNPFFIRGQSTQATFQELFAAEGQSSVDREGTILQALALMNGDFVSRATNVRQSRTLGAVSSAPFMNTSEKIETLYLATLTRKPRANELERLQRYIESGAPPKNTVGLLAGLSSLLRNGLSEAVVSTPQEEALSDVFWSLLNSSEFLLNH